MRFEPPSFEVERDFWNGFFATAAVVGTVAAAVELTSGSIQPALLVTVVCGTLASLGAIVRRSRT